MTFFALTVFQATGKKRQPIILSVLRKGTVDVPFMLLFNHIFGIRGVAWATPVAEIISLLVAAVMVVPYIYGKGRTVGTAFKSCSVYIVCAHC